MSPDETSAKADFLYAEGMAFCRQEDRYPSAPTLARSAFKRAAAMGHGKSARALAHLVFQGRGGVKDPDDALLMLWSTFDQADLEALDELQGMLGSYRELPLGVGKATAAAACAHHLAELRRNVSEVSSFMSGLVRERAARDSE